MKKILNRQEKRKRQCLMDSIQSPSKLYVQNYKYNYKNANAKLIINHSWDFFGYRIFLLEN